jgi:ribosomal 50S subunit-associated protein YjgA (DUF615 family)
MNDFHRPILLSLESTGLDEIVAWCNPTTYHTSECPKDHAIMNDACVLAVERYMAYFPDKQFRVVWANKYGAVAPKLKNDLWSQRKTDISSVRDALEKVRRDAKQKKKENEALKNLEVDEEDLVLYELAAAAKAVTKRADFSTIPSENTLVTINQCLDYVYRLNQEKNLYHMCDDLRHLHITDNEIMHSLMSYKWPAVSYKRFRYIVNHTKRVFIDKAGTKDTWTAYETHPLPYLTCEFNTFDSTESRGGPWLGDSNSVSVERPGSDYTLIRTQ